MAKKVSFNNSGSIARLKSMAEPLTQNDIRNAIKQYLKQDCVVKTYSDSTTYDLIVDGEPYPPKAIFGLAMSKLLGIEVKSTHFSAGLKSPCFTTFENLGFDIRSKENSQTTGAKKNTNALWTENELSKAIDAYLEMLEKSKRGIKYSKTNYYRMLSKEFGRSHKAYGRRMSNISYIMTLMGLPTEQGLAPLSNVGPTQTAVIERLISEKLNRPYLGLGIAAAEENSTVTSKTVPERPSGEENPKSVETTTTVYQRSGKVKGWVIRRSNGHCELCEKEAPFTKEDGTPFLEVHHLTRMIDGGPDTIQNCAALCPNCHRKLHHCADRVNLTEGLRNKVLKKESGL
ncbi:HNH endonuclease [Vibrio campbellii]|uniref:HNH endonuclease n=1 Tax=Vibrio campbellii TaxID=680 RepID=UPI001E489C36|nr:HNH endonuclease [Vibrio campbellii]MCC8253394.1 HNH endonuclease [Vibrio campbellii CAIM 333]